MRLKYRLEQTVQITRGSFSGCKASIIETRTFDSYSYKLQLKDVKVRPMWFREDELAEVIT